MTRGYMGKLLFVDLSVGKIREEELEEKLCRDYVGGYGIGARILYSRQRGGVNALGPENTLGFMTGPLTGTPAFLGCRHTVVAKSPLTGGWGDSNAGGDFGPFLKFAGYDGVFFTGISERPVYLLIDDGKAEIRDASHLWGRGTFEVEDMIKEEVGAGTSVACIGQAGEKLSLIASVMTYKGKTAGRTGLGAVMGSKRLKGIGVRGKGQVPIADKKRLDSIRREQLALIMRPITARWRKFGTCQFAGPLAIRSRSVIKNYAGVGEIDFPEGRYIGDVNIIKYQVRKEGCWRCPIRCSGRLKAGEGEYQWQEGAKKPEYETLAALGSRCLNGNVPSLIKEAEICDRYGLDTISTGAVLAFAIECYEKGIITKQDTEGIELKWGNHRAHVKMVEKIAKREGFGGVLADGVKVAAERIGKGAEQYAIHIGGQEPSATDPKGSPGIMTSFLMDAAPSRHMQGGAWQLESGLSGLGLGIDVAAVEPYVYSGKGEGHKKMSAFYHVINSAGLCLMPYFGRGECGHARYLVDSLNAATGFDYDLEGFLKIGDRIATIRRAFNIREGINPLQVAIPGRMIGKPPMEVGPWKGVEIDLDTQVRDYLTAMDWDLETAKPSRRALEKLGLGDIVRDIWP